MSDETVVILCGIYSLGFAAFHASFWRLFDWPQALKRSNVATLAITQILNLRLIYVFLAVGALCLAMPRDLLHTRLGHAVMAGMALFWMGRTVEQFVFLRYRHVLVHVLTVLFALGTFLFAWPLRHLL